MDLEPESADAVAAAHHDGGVGRGTNARAVRLQEIQVVFRELCADGSRRAGCEIHGGALRHAASDPAAPRPDR